MPNRRALWLAAGSMLLVGVVSGSAGAQPPSHVATVTGFAPVSPQEPRRAAPAVPEDAGATLDPSTVLRPSVAPRPPAPIPTARVVVGPRVVVPVKVRPAGGSITGVASWFCLTGVSRCTRGYPSGSFVAAIRRDLLGHRGDRARVCLAGTSRCVTVRVVDCNCGPGANLIDLYAAPFKVLAPLSRGRLHVSLSWLG